MQLSFSTIVDLSHPFSPGGGNVNGSLVAMWPVRSFEFTRTLSSGKAEYVSNMLLFPEHSGTHLDAPLHFVPGAKSVADVPLETLILPGHLLDFTHKKNGEPITISDVEKAEIASSQKIEKGKAIVFWTGTDKDWNQGNWIKDRPFVPVDTAQWLVDRGMTLFVTDLVGMDDPAEWWWPTHKIWLENDICMVQQVCNLGELKGKKFTFVALPMKIPGGSGCPLRAIALVE